MVTQATMEHQSPKLLTTTNLPSIDHLSTDAILSLRQEGSSHKTVADTVAETVGHLSENVVISRGCTLSASKGLMCSFAYNNVRPPDAPLGMGTYAALVHLLPSGGGEVAVDSARALGRQLCQHVIGMCPKAVYPRDDVDESQALVEQDFVLDASIRVGDLLRENCVEVTRFVRFELGEKQEQSEI